MNARLTSGRVRKERKTNKKKKKMTNLSVDFAVQVIKKIKHGARGEVTALAPMVSSVIVFKGLREGNRGSECRPARFRDVLLRGGEKKKKDGG